MGCSFKALAAQAVCSRASFFSLLPVRVLPHHGQDAPHAQGSLRVTAAASFGLCQQGAHEGFPLSVAAVDAVRHAEVGEVGQFRHLQPLGHMVRQGQLLGAVKAAVQVGVDGVEASRVVGG